MKELGSTSTIGLLVVVGILGAGLVGSFLYMRGRNNDLVQKKNNLIERNETLIEKNDRLSENYSRLSSKIDTLKENRLILLEKLRELQDNYSGLLSEYRSLTENYEEIKNQLENMSAGDRYNLHEPTMNELRSFLSRDTTDEKEYDRESYTCVDYSKDLINGAQEEGLMAGYVSIGYEDRTAGHAIAVFRTANSGLVYVEPQHDIIVKDLNVGDSYNYVLEEYSDYDFPERELIIDDLDLIW